MNMKIQISDSVTLKQVLRKVKDEDESVKAAKKLVKMLLPKVSDSKNKTEFSEEERKKLAEEGLALPDGSFPIRNKQDLKDAIKAIGLARSYSKTKQWIIKRARELDALDLLPEKWKVKDSNAVTLDRDDNWGNGTRVYMLFQGEDGKPVREYGKIMGYSVSAGTANIRWEDGYQPMYDVAWDIIYKAD